jgi:8-oxo-dGTP pyrophosphatase MutT (NUDIX family)
MSQGKGCVCVWGLEAAGGSRAPDPDPDSGRPSHVRSISRLPTSKRYSTLAGFLEVGETLEQALAREVEEESAVPVAPETIRWAGGAGARGRCWHRRQLPDAPCNANNEGRKGSSWPAAQACC